LPKPKQS